MTDDDGGAGARKSATAGSEVLNEASVLSRIDSVSEESSLRTGGDAIESVLVSQALLEPTEAFVQVRTFAQPGYWGGLGEQTMAFLLGKLGWSIIIGPGGAAGKSAYANGIDVLAVKGSGNGLEVMIGDNKASGLAEPIRECSAFTENVAKKLTDARAQVAGLRDLPQSKEILAKLDRTLKAVAEGGGPMPEGVRWSITNAGGYADGVTLSLQDKFFKATGLTEPTGQPAKIEFLNLVPPAEIQTRRELATALGGRNPRGSTKVVLQEQVIIAPASQVLRNSALPHEVVQGAWLLALAMIELIIAELFAHFFDTTCKTELKQLEPSIVETLERNPGKGALLIIAYWVPEYSPRDLLDTAVKHSVLWEFSRWEVSYGVDAETAYGAWLAPAKIESSRAAWTPPQHRRYSFLWFDRESVRSYQPPK